MVAECYFTELVNFATHRENILDIVFANQPSFANCCTVVPGVSDHNALLLHRPLIRMRLNTSVIYGIELTLKI